MAKMANILKIIKAVESHECLWNIHSPIYAKRNKVERAWLEVAKEVGKDDIFCREKWRNVRTGFLRSTHNYASSYRKNRASDNFHTPRRKRFYLHDEMKFLLQGRAKRRQKHSSKADNTSKTDDESNHCYSNIAIYSQMESFGLEADIKPECVLVPSQKHEDDLCAEVMQEEEIMTDFTADATETVDSLMSINNVSGVEQKSQNSDAEPKLYSDRGNKVTTEDRNCDGRNERQLLAFFQSNIDDILSLSYRNQRLFKRRMLELIEELHQSEYADD